ncbi:MAG: RNA-binding S4 domain-containing protein [Prevotellaceae bacterium]|jgi:ribosome-associated protein|nr:RNA-binding S4 domain-containing protein [Prevotellaceae bacterium]
MDFKLTDGDYIELCKLLKIINLASSGAEAKIMIDEGMVKRNGAVELRRRAKLRAGEVIEIDDTIINIV